MNYTVADFLRETGYPVRKGSDLATKFAGCFMVMPKSGLITNREQIGWAYIVAENTGTVDVVGGIQTASAGGEDIRVEIYDRSTYIGSLPSTLILK